MWIKDKASMGYFGPLGEEAEDKEEESEAPPAPVQQARPDKGKARRSILAQGCEDKNCKCLDFHGHV